MEIRGFRLSASGKAPGPCGKLRPSVLLLQVHPAVHARDLVSVAIEHQRWSFEEFAKPAFSGLAPAWMIHIGIHVGIEAVFRRRGKSPAVVRRLISAPDAHDGSRALEAILPRQNDTQRSTILIGQI